MEKEIYVVTKVDDEDLGEFVTRIDAQKLNNASLLKLIGILEGTKYDILKELEERTEV